MVSIILLSFYIILLYLQYNTKNWLCQVKNLLNHELHGKEKSISEDQNISGKRIRKSEYQVLIY